MKNERVSNKIAARLGGIESQLKTLNKRLEKLIETNDEVIK